MNWLPPEYHRLFSQQEIQQRVRALGARITTDYQNSNLTVLVVLKGSFMFASDLVRAIEQPMNVEFIGLRSYGDRTSTSGVVEITLDVKHPLTGEDVLIVEDIVDTGLTLDYLMKNLATRKPKSIQLATMLNKPARRLTPVDVNYIGFEIPDRFVVGYGLDYAGKYRNLPEIGYLDPVP